MGTPFVDFKYWQGFDSGAKGVDFKFGYLADLPDPKGGMLGPTIGITKATSDESGTRDVGGSIGLRFKIDWSKQLPGEIKDFHPLVPYADLGLFFNGDYGVLPEGSIPNEKVEDSFAWGGYIGGGLELFTLGNVLGVSAGVYAAPGTPTFFAVTGLTLNFATQNGTE